MNNEKRSSYAAAITGATGFIGSHLARELLGRGWTVHALKRAESSVGLLADVAAQIQWHDADPAVMESAWDSIGRADVVFHLATEYGRDNVPASRVAEVNLIFPLRLLEQANRMGVPLVVATGTYFPTSYPYLRHYTLTKKQFSEWGKVWSQETGRRFISVELQHAFGPGDRTGKFVPWIMGQCAQNAERIELTSGTQEKDFVYIDDVVDALIVLHDQQDHLPSQYCEVPCGSGSTVSLRKFIELVHAASKSTSELAFGVLPNREGELQRSCADVHLLKSLGWTAKTRIEDGIRMALDHLDMQSKRDT